MNERRKPSWPRPVPESLLLEYAECEEHARALFQQHAAALERMRVASQAIFQHVWDVGSASSPHDVDEVQWEECKRLRKRHGAIRVRLQMLQDVAWFFGCRS
jgi:hypothetical protein